MLERLQDGRRKTPNLLMATSSVLNRTATTALPPRSVCLEGTAVSASGYFAGKRAAVVVFSYYPIDVRPRREAEALARHGMEVDVVCLKSQAHHPVYEKVPGVNVFQTPICRRREGKTQYAIQYTSFFLAAFSIVTFRHLRKAYDLVHVHNMPDFLVFSGLVPRLSGAKLLLDLHDPMPELFSCIYGAPSSAWPVRMLQKVEKLSIAFASRVLTPNLAFAQLFGSRSCSADKIDIIMNSPQESFFGRFDEATPADWRQKKSFDLVYHGLLAERQGVDLAVQAIQRLRNQIPGLKLHLYGDPTPYQTEVMGLVKHLRLEQFVEYHGFKPPEAIPPVISSADMGLVPNRLNPFTQVNMPTRIFEYLARNRMAVVARTRGVEDYFKDGELIFFEPGNPDDLARKIHWAYSNPTEVQSMLTRGRASYWQHRWEMEERRFIDLTRRLLAT